MAFTDDDLKRLKERFKDHTAHCQDCSCTFGNEELPSLLARLETAEKRADALAGKIVHDDDCGGWYELDDIQPLAFRFSDCDCGIKDSEEAWRKAAGK